VSLNVHGKYNLLNIFNYEKQILNLGKALNKAEQKLINGGLKEPRNECETHDDCYGHELCNVRDNYCYDNGSERPGQ
jgi:hypothetical protein